MTRRPTVNRAVAAATTTLVGPKPNRSAPPAARPRPKFKPGFFANALIVRTKKDPVTNLDLLRGDVVLGPPEMLGSLSGPQNFEVVCWMSSATYDLVTEDQKALSDLQMEIAKHAAYLKGGNVGVKAKIVDVSQQSFGPPQAVVDRNAPVHRADDLEVFVQQVTNLFTDIQGFDMSRMTGETRLEFFNRYGLLRDRVRMYRELMGQVEGSFEVLQKKMMELAE